MIFFQSLLMQLPERFYLEEIYTITQDLKSQHFEVWTEVLDWERIEEFAMTSINEEPTKPETYAPSDLIWEDLCKNEPQSLAIVWYKVNFGLSNNGDISVENDLNDFRAKTYEIDIPLFLEILMVTRTTHFRIIMSYMC